MAKTATKTSGKRGSAKSMKKSLASRQRTVCGNTAKQTSSFERDEEVTIDRRRASERRGEEVDSAETAPAPKLERRKKVNRRRQIDPTTCERDYTEAEVEFMNALDDYKRKSGRMFPTCSEVLEVIHSLGYAKLMPGQLAGDPASHATTASAKPMPGDLQESESEFSFDAAGELLL